MPTESGCRFGVRFFRVRQSRFYYIFVCACGVRWFYYLSQWWAEPSERWTKRFSYLDERATDSILLSFSWLNEPYDFLILTDHSDFNILWGTKRNPVFLTGLTLEQSAGVAESAENESGYEGVFEDYAHNLEFLFHYSRFVLSLMNWSGSRFECPIYSNRIPRRNVRAALNTFISSSPSISPCAAISYA